MSKPFRRKGSQVWYIRVKGVRKSTGTASLEDAKAYLAKLEHDAWREERMGVKPPRSWEEAVVRYLREVGHQTSYRWKVAVLREWGRHFEGRELRTITRDVVDSLLDPTREASPHNHTLNKKVAILHNLLTKAAEEWEWLDRKPKFREYPIPGPREKWLTPQMWSALSASLSGSLLQFATLALATGLRSGRLAGILWSQYDVSRRLLIVSGNGGKRANSIPLNDAAVAVLEARRTAPVRDLIRVFPEIKREPIRQFASQWERVRKIPGLEGVGVHTLRHTFNTWLAHAGVSREIRMYLMGHVAGDTHAVYTHWGEEQLRPAVKVIDTVLTQGTERALEKSGT